MSQDRFTKLARGKDCMIRLPAVCNRNSETTVLAHLRLSGLSGMGMKVHSFLGAYACSACHSFVDAHHDDKTKVAFYQGIFRTQAQLLKQGHI